MGLRRLRAQAQREHAARQAVLVLGWRRRRPRRKGARSSSAQSGRSGARRRRWPPRATLQVGVDVARPDPQRAWLPTQTSRCSLASCSTRSVSRGATAACSCAGLVQVADDALLAMYKLPVGGRYSVRGYRESQLVRDHGFVASAEYAVSRARRRDRSAPRPSSTSPCSRTTACRSTRTSRRSRRGASTCRASALGLLWRPLPGFHLRDLSRRAAARSDNADETLQDRGIHYNLSYSGRSSHAEHAHALRSLDLLVAASAASPPASLAQIVLDGTTGTAGRSRDRLHDPGHARHAGRRKPVSQLQRLQRARRRTATFTSGFAGTTQNIVGRVTGAAASHSGRPHCEPVPGAELLAHQSERPRHRRRRDADVQGSFYASGADACCCPTAADSTRRIQADRRLTVAIPSHSASSTARRAASRWAAATLPRAGRPDGRRSSAVT